MKRFLFILLIPVIEINSFSQTPVLKWLGGSKLVNQSGVYGTLGVASANNFPGAREASISWSGDSDNFWLFGGYGYEKNGTLGELNALWKRGLVNNTWTWVGGSNTKNQNGTYGTKGSGNNSNIPGARKGTAGWKDGSGTFWLFGGYGYPDSGSPGYLNDLWKYEPDIHIWTWVSGTNLISQNGVYGTLNHSSINYIPGSGMESVTWIDQAGKLWLFGGYGYDVNGTTGYLNSLWNFDPLSGQWTWKAGNNIVNQHGEYGTIEIGNTANNPGSRSGAVSWIDNSGNFWLFGGYGYDKNGSLGDLNDLWKYDLKTAEWSWIGGSDLISQPDNYVESDTSVVEPGARHGSVTWTDGYGNLWLFGGYGVDLDDSAGNLNDLWKYEPNTSRWTWVGGGNIILQPGVYGILDSGNTSNIPGARSFSASSTENNGNLLMFGGNGVDSNGSQGELNDLWEISFIPKGVSHILCTTVTQSQLTINWNKDYYAFGYRLDVSKDSFNTYVSPYQQFVISDTFQILSGLDPGSSYYLRIKSFNMLGDSPASSILIVSTIPATPVFNEVTGITQNSFILNWDNIAGANHYILDISSDNFSTFIPGYWNDTIAGSAIKITGLQPGTSYQARLRSNNLSGSSPYSNEANVLTIPANPVTGPATGINQMGFTAHWEAVAGADDYVYEIAGTRDLSVIIVSDTITADSVQVTGLDEGTNYYYHVRAGNASGLSGYSDTISVITVPPAPVVTADHITQEGFTASWQSCRGVGHYELELSQDNFSTLIPGYDPGELTDTTIVLSGLSGGSKYQFRVKAANLSGSSPYSNEVNELTLPADPVAGPATGISQQGFVAHWEAVAGADDYLYEIAGARDLSVIIDRDTITADSVQVTGLDEGTNYYYHVRAGNASGLSGYSDTIGLITIPPAPVVTADHITQEGFTASWRSCRGAEHYELELSQDNFTTLIPGYNPGVLTDTSIVLTGLAGGAQYQLRLTAANSSGKSPYSNLISRQLVPATPVALNATNATDTSFLAKWENVVGVSYYILDVSSDDFQSFVEGYNGLRITNFTEVSVRGLNPSTAYGYRVKAGNDAGVSPNSNVITAITLNHGEQTSFKVSNLKFDNYYKAGTPGDTIRFIVTGGIKPYTIQVYYKGVLDNNYKSIKARADIDGSVQAVAMDSMMDKMGMMFNISVTDFNDSSINTETKSIFRSFTTSSSPSIPLTYSGGTLKTYQIISIPYILDDNRISTIFEPSLGKYNKKKWRLVYFLNNGDGKGGYVDYSSEINRLEPGKGYWFNSREKTDIYTGAGHINDQQPFTLDLKTGWNQIGDPYNIPLSWERILANNGNPDGVRNYKVYDAQNISFSDSDRMMPFTGGFVWSDTSINLSIDPKTDQWDNQGMLREDKNGKLQPEEWELYLSIEQNGKLLSLGSFGMRDNAKDLKDNYDEMELPDFVNYLNFYTTHKEYFYPWFTRDIVSPKDSFRWNFKLASDFISGPVSIFWTFKNCNKDDQYYLFDSNSGILVNMKNVTSYRFDFTGINGFKFYYIKGNREMVIPDTYMLGNAYPNPAGDLVTIPVSLPRAGVTFRINLSVYDLKGEKIKTISEGNYTAGYYEFSWSYKNDPAHVAPGLYIYRLEIYGSYFKPEQKKLLLN